MWKALSVTASHSTLFTLFAKEALGEDIFHLICLIWKVTGRKYETKCTSSCSSLERRHQFKLDLKTIPISEKEFLSETWKRQLYTEKQMEKYSVVCLSRSTDTSNKASVIEWVRLLYYWNINILWIMYVFDAQEIFWGSVVEVILLYDNTKMFSSVNTWASSWACVF